MMIPDSLKRILDAKKPKPEGAEYTVIWRDGEVLRVKRDGTIKVLNPIKPIS